MSFISSLKGDGPSGFGYRSTAEAVTEGLDLRGRVILLTGCNSGIGLESFRVFALRGATVLALARTREKARDAAEQAVPAGSPGRAEPHACELSDPASVRACVAAIREDGHRIDAMVLNAGIMGPAARDVQRGLEIQFLTNHMGHFLLATGLLDRLTATGRVVSLSSMGHQFTVSEGIALDDLSMERGYNRWRAYGQSKLANLLFAKALAARLPASQVALAVHPGVISTNLGRNMGGLLQRGFGLVGPLFGKTHGQGAATQVWAAVHPDAAAHSGAYLDDCNVSTPSKHGRDAALAERLWQVSESLAQTL